MIPPPDAPSPFSTFQTSDALIPTAALRGWVFDLFRAAGASAHESELAAGHLVEANLTGHDSHGVGMVPRYVAALRAGELRLGQTIDCVTDAGSLLVIDGCGGLGQSVGHQAMAMAIERTRQQGCVVMALRNGIYRAREWGGPLHKLADAPYDTDKQRFNDGKCDAQGRFWAGSLYEPKDQALGVLYKLDGQGLHAMQGGVTTANGLAWSPDGRTAYWADTAAHQVRAFDFDPVHGQLSGERLFHQMASKPSGWAWGSDTPYGGRPDGAAVDAEGCYWSAQFEGQRLLRLSPAGEVLQVVETPVPCPTMPCFGGDDLKTLFITSARQGRSEAELAVYPQAGCIFATRLEVPGLPVNFYRP